MHEFYVTRGRNRALGEKEKPRSDRRTDSEKERENVRGRGRGVLLAKRVLVPQYRTGHV